MSIAARWAVRMVATAAAADAIVQAMLAGKFLAGNYDALGVHAGNGGVLALITLVFLLAALLDRQLSHGPWWPILTIAAVQVALGIQRWLGESNRLAWHVPLGITIVTSLLMVTVWSWRTRPVVELAR
ncbi:hypothetical protein [Nocardia sp. CDC160]|uniref:hypothetical protein n=1 Tax=Nocardia sp. CDC160 TaxID=3112166 RepID=UPI002DC02FF3|nr:hypothetical protein [Nocardia sp. CDC160]MEC3920253.1 hypothetical protein [Nocardia sp. CDC160]